MQVISFHDHVSPYISFYDIRSRRSVYWSRASGIREVVLGRRVIAQCGRHIPVWAHLSFLVLSLVYNTILFRANHDDAVVYNEDTNICLQSALDEAAGKPGRHLQTVKDGKRLMPRPGEVDFIAGGFPCQSFSGMNHQRKKSDDDIRYVIIFCTYMLTLLNIYPRTTLVANMLSYVDLYRPRFVLMENVKGLLQHHSKIGRLGSSEDIADTVEEVKMSIVKLILRTLLHMGLVILFYISYALFHVCLVIKSDFEF